jgi:hypothetical protein
MRAGRCGIVTLPPEVVSVSGNVSPAVDVVAWAVDVVAWAVEPHALSRPSTPSTTVAERAR